MNQPPQNPNNSPSLNDSANSTDVILNGKTVLVELPYNIAAAVCYVPFLLNILAPAAWLYSEPKENRFVRYHAVQGLLLAIAFFLLITVANTLFFVVSFIPLIEMVNGIVVLALWFGYLGISFRLGFSAFKAQPGKLPVVSKYIEDAMDQYNL